MTGTKMSHGVAANRPRAPRLFVYVDNYRVQFRPLLRRFHAHRQAGKKTLDHDIGLHADHGMVRPGHAAIRLVRGSSRENAGVRRGHMGMGSDHR